MTGGKVVLERSSGCDIVTPHGDLDVFSAARLRSVVFDPSSCSQPVLVLDLSEIAFIDSTGLGVLVATRRWTRTRSADLVIVVKPSSVVARLLSLAGLDAVFTTVATRAEAVRLVDERACVAH